MLLSGERRAVLLGNAACRRDPDKRRAAGAWRSGSRREHGASVRLYLGEAGTAGARAGRKDWRAVWTPARCWPAAQAYLWWLRNHGARFGRRRRQGAKALAGRSGRVVQRLPANVDVANVLLPIAPFTETGGTFVNAEGRLQSLPGVVRPLAETRPGWKVLRAGQSCWTCRASNRTVEKCAPRPWRRAPTASPRAWTTPPRLRSPDRGSRRSVCSVRAINHLTATDAIVRRADRRFNQTTPTRRAIQGSPADVLRRWWSARGWRRGGRVGSVCRRCAGRPGCRHRRWMARAHPAVNASATAKLGAMFGAANVVRGGLMVKASRIKPPAFGPPGGPWHAVV